jgi:N,N'-diacetylchitobiose transport system permease protein
VTTTKGIAPTVSAPLPVKPKGITGRRSGPLSYGLLVPSLLAIGLALAYPLVRQVVLSLQEYGLAQQFGRPAEWLA